MTFDAFLRQRSFEKTLKRLTHIISQWSVSNSSSSCLHFALFPSNPPPRRRSRFQWIHKLFFLHSHCLYNDISSHFMSAKCVLTATKRHTRELFFLLKGGFAWCSLSAFVIPSTLPSHSFYGPYLMSILM